MFYLIFHFNEQFYNLLSPILYRLRREAAQVDRQLEAAQSETNRLRTILRQREAEVQRLRERVMAQRAARAAREAAKQAAMEAENKK